ncbi:substrate-binding periplasmic protein [Chitinimonas lacunae]|uniref:Substrate-binding periplasmic protein n=1 Tax=Chitinimonas lacunae TaxID=1963018 RepID=A0ABV8MPB8_9NEIS
MSIRFISLIAALCLGPLLALAEPVEFHVAYEDKDTPDHTGTIDVPANNPGITVEMLNMLPSRIPELRLVYSRKPWARCLMELEAGTADAVFASSFKTERLKIGVYPMKNGKVDRTYRIDTKSYSLYKRKDSQVNWDGSRFDNVRQEIVAMRGYAVADDLRKLGIAVHEVDRSENAFRMVLSGRVDGFAQLTEVGDYTLRKYPDLNQAIIKVEVPLAVKDYYLQISHAFYNRYPELSQTIWKTLADIRQAEQDRLNAKYMPFYQE